MNIISLDKITKYYSGETVLSNISLNIEDNDRIGLIGINGCGKSTLLRIITKQESPENLSAPNEPVIHRAKNKTIGYLAQNSALETENTVYTEMRGCFKELDDISARLREMEADMREENAAQYSRLLSYYELNDGYLIDVKINKVLGGMGFAADTYERSVSTFSGGEKTRLAIAKLLLTNPDLLILDEPTNHLDFDTVIWLEDYLQDYKGAFLIVSHDRYFLDKLCTSICEIRRGTLCRYKGNYTAYTKQRQMNDERQLKEYEAQQNTIAKYEDYIARNLTRASTSNMAKSRVKKLEAMERIDKPVLYEKPAKIHFSYSIKPPKDILSIRDLDVTAGDKTLFTGLSLDISFGEKIGIIGPNGIGKSMLIKSLLGIVPVTKGRVNWGANVKVSYFDQESAELDFNDTVIEAVHKRFRSKKEGEIRSLLARVRLTGDDVFKKVGVISGGERAKLCFAIMILEHGNTLILDEPTNHLDILSKEAIETALVDFPGTVIFISHDRYLLNILSTRILEITKDGANIYNGGYDAYINQKREKPAADIKEPVKTEDKKEKPSYRDKNKRAEDAKKRGRVSELERIMEILEAKIKTLEAELLNEEVYRDYKLAHTKTEELNTAKQELNAYTDEWLLLNEEDTT